MLAWVLLTACTNECTCVDSSSTTTPPPPPPNDVTCPDGGGPCVVRGTLYGEVRFTADRAWNLRGAVQVGDDEAAGSLTIEAGTTVVLGSELHSSLTVRRGSEIHAGGTEWDPIVFTSDAPPGARARGDWSGLRVEGRAPVNGADDGYGGDDPDDDSGELSFVRIEFGGPLTLAGVGAGTRIAHAQVHQSAADGVVLLGGAADLAHVVVTGAAGAGFSWDRGWVGHGQFLVAQGDGDGLVGSNHPDDFDAEPRSAPHLANATLAGGGIALRQGTAGRLHALLVAADGPCFAVADDATFAQAALAQLKVRSSILDCVTPFADAASEALFTTYYDDLLAPIGFPAPFDPLAPGLVPPLASPAASGGTTTGHPFFTPVAYRGAIDPSVDWLAEAIADGWLSTAPN